MECAVGLRSFLGDCVGTATGGGTIVIMGVFPINCDGGVMGKCLISFRAGGIPNGAMH